MGCSFNEKVKSLMEKYPDLFPTEAKFWSFLRGSLRRSLWSKSPMKLRFKQSTATPPPEGYTGRGRKGHFCALTGEWVAVSKSEVDHMEGNVSLSREEDIIPFIIHMLADEDQLQVVSKEAHKIKSMAERQGITFEEAQAEKTAISLIKGKRDRQWLNDNGIVPETNQIKRRKQIVEHLLKGKPLLTHSFVNKENE